MSWMKVFPIRQAASKLLLRSFERPAAWEIDDEDYPHKGNGACPKCVDVERLYSEAFL